MFSSSILDVISSPYHSTVRFLTQHPAFCSHEETTLPPGTPASHQESSVLIYLGAGETNGSSKQLSQLDQGGEQFGEN
jgi:hypothetical protein